MTEEQKVALEFAIKCTTELHGAYTDPDHDGEAAACKCEFGTSIRALRNMLATDIDAAYIEQFVTADSPAVKARQRIEIAIAKAFVDAALAAKYSIVIDNGDGNEQPAEQTTDAVLKIMFQTDDEYVYLTHGDATGDIIEAWVHFVYGNDGWDVISDYSVCLEPLMQGEVKRLQELYG